eukprot:GEMP01054555.1.p1 GENE.GEMP01054555.1~~GEMP01054555.1.p1  ORF type:complete len:439 (+),score=83.81 GEMP01054555.1:164-1480(+)
MSHSTKRRRLGWPKSVGGASVMDYFLSLPCSFLTVEQEIARRKHWMRMREAYADLVAEHLGEHFTVRGDNPAAVPRESFNRWLFSPSSEGLKNELLEDIPVKIAHAFPSQKEEQMKNTRLMAEALQKWMEGHESDEQTAQWCANVLAGDAEAENNNELRYRARAVVAKRATPAIERIVSELTNLRDKGHQAECEEWDVEVNFDSVKNRFVASAISDDDEICFPINVWNYVRLAQQFEGVRKIWDAAQVAIPAFENALFCLLCRYDALCGPGECEGRGLHGTLPQGFFEVLGKEVTECFASPLNVWCPSDDKGLRFFCSFFLEDRCFGSLGSFFDPRFEPTEGLFEINPPFDCEVMESVIKRVDAWLSRATKEERKLAFIIVFPEWRRKLFHPFYVVVRGPLVENQVPSAPKHSEPLSNRVSQYLLPMKVTTMKRWSTS